MAGMNILRRDEPGLGRHVQRVPPVHGKRQTTFGMDSGRLEDEYSAVLPGNMTRLSVSGIVSSWTKRLLLPFSTEEMRWLADRAFRGLHHCL